MPSQRRRWHKFTRTITAKGAKKSNMLMLPSQRRALRQGAHDRTLKRHEDEDGDDEEERDMSISPERDIPVEVAFEETQQQEAAIPGTTQTQPNINGDAASTNLPQMPLTVGGKI
jgi:hypothetical protein